MNEDTRLATGLAKESKGFSLVWIAPIIAILITTGMIYKTYVDAGTRIKIVINNGDGIKDGKTPIMYKGIKIGVVEDIHIKEDDVSKLELNALINKAAAPGVTREGNMFWVVKPKVSITEVTGLDTIVSGVYISVMPIKNSKDELYALPYQDHFIALDSPPVDTFDPGLAIQINTLNKGDIAIGAPVLYNKQAIGKVEDKRLSADRLSIDLFIRIESKYADLVHTDSVFYKADALDFQANLSAVKFQMGSFASFIAGGIAMHNTPRAFASPQAEPNRIYKLYDHKDDILLSDDVVVLMMQEHHDLSPNISKVFYKGVEAGVVKSITYDPQKDSTRLSVKLHQKFRSFANAKAYFWIIKPQLEFDGISGLDTVVRGSYIRFSSSDIKAQKKDSFILHENPPQPEGKHISLLAENMEGIKAGAGLFYHNVKIGSVNGYTINGDKKSFTIDLIILDKYLQLINASSRFYHHSGISLRADLRKVSVETGSLETIMRGGIAVETFDFNTAKRMKKNYVLYANKEQMLRANYLASGGLMLTLYADESYNIKEASPVVFKNIKAGEVVNHVWNKGQGCFETTVFINPEFASEVHANTRFYDLGGIEAKIGLDGVNIKATSMETILSGGVGFYTPAVPQKDLANNKDRFVLHKSLSAAQESFMNLEFVSSDPSGLKAGSPIRYKGVRIGEIAQLELEDRQVKLYAQVERKYRKMINSTSLFWIDDFSLSIQGLKNPASALLGPYISLKPGDSQTPQNTFTLMSKAPLPHDGQEGLRIHVLADRLGGLKPGSPLYYRQVKIGSVVQYALSQDAKSVDMELFIEPCYAHLIRSNSYFFNAGGVGMDIGLFSAKVQTETLESILTGGLGVLTPDEFEEQAEEGAQFRLHDTFDEDALEWAPELYSEREECRV